MERKQIEKLKEKITELRERKKKEIDKYDKLINDLKKQINRLEGIVLNKKSSH